MINRNTSMKKSTIQILTTLLVLGFLVLLSGTGAAVNDTTETVYYYQVGINHLAGTWHNESGSDLITIPDNSSYYINPNAVKEGTYYRDGDEIPSIINVMAACLSYANISEHTIYCDVGEYPRVSKITIEDPAGLNPTVVFKRYQYPDTSFNEAAYDSPGVYKIDTEITLVRGTCDVYADFGSNLTSNAPFDYRYCKIGTIKIDIRNDPSSASLSISSNTVPDDGGFTITVNGPYHKANTLVETGVVTVYYYEDGKSQSDRISIRAENPYTTNTSCLSFNASQRHMVGGKCFILDPPPVTISIHAKTGSTETKTYHLEVYVSGCGVDKPGGVDNPLKADISVLPNVSEVTLSSTIPENEKSMSTTVVASSNPLDAINTPILNWNSDGSMFSDGQTYTATIVVTTKSDYLFTTSPSIILNGTQVPSSEIVISDDRKTITINHTYGKLETPGTLSVSSDPSGANVIVDGSSYGVTPTTINLNSGSHYVMVEKSGYIPYNTTVTINGNKITSLSPTLSETSTYGILSVLSNQSGAIVYVDDINSGITPAYITCKSGTHTVRVELTGYESYTTTVNITKGNTTTLSPTLTKVITTGTLSVSSYPSEATVYVDGTSYGITPITINLNAGTYTVRVELSGYESSTTATTITSGNTTSISPTLTKIITPGTLSVSSNPSGATVYVDGTSYGVTPATINLNAGTRTVKVEKQGYESYTTTVTITDGKTTTISPTLTKLVTEGTLSISSSPSNSEVYVGGNYKGTTPLTTNIENGTYPLRIEKEGYEPYTSTVTITSGKTTTLSPQLTKTIHSGTLAISTTPSGATVYVDGSVYGTTQDNITFNFTLNKGTHTIRIEKEGYEPYQETVVIFEGETSYLSPKLSLKQSSSTTMIGNVSEKTESSGINIVPVIIAIVVVLIVGAVVVVAVSRKSSQKKGGGNNTTRSYESKTNSAKTTTPSKTKQVNNTTINNNTTIKNETKTEVKEGDTIINIHAENYVAGNVGTIAKDDAVVNRSGVDIFEQVKKCPYCGSDISADSYFCSNCGKRLK